MKFNYRARSKEGEMRQGVVEVASQEAAINLLEAHGLIVTFLEPAEIRSLWEREVNIFGGISKKEIVMFFRQLSILFGAGVTLTESLRVLTNQTENLNLRKKILKIIEEVEGGMALSQALGRHPKLFSSFYVSMVKSGEVSGTLSQSLNYLADHLEREEYLISKVRGAMIYPALILFVFLAIAFIMVFWIFPQLMAIFKETGKELPLMTKILLGTADFLREKGWLIIFLISGLIIFGWRYKKTIEGKRVFDETSLRLPFIGKLSKMFCLTRFAENLSTLIAGGLPIAEALEISGDVVGNEIYKEIILYTQAEVRKGIPISRALSHFPKEISPLFIQITLVGEKSGKLDSVLKHIVDFYQREVETMLENILNLIEPFLILVLGLGVGLFVASVLLPLYGMIASF